MPTASIARKDRLTARDPGQTAGDDATWTIATGVVVAIRASLLCEVRPVHEVLAVLVDKYAEYGVQELKFPDALDAPPLSASGFRDEIIARFGDATRMRGAVDELNRLLYAA